MASKDVNDKEKNKDQKALSTDNNDKTPQTIPPEIIKEFEEMPPEVRKEAFSFLSMAFRGGGISNPLFDKFNDSHIDKYLDYIQRDDDHEFELRKSNRYFQLVYLIIAGGILIGLAYFLIPNNQDLFVKIVEFIVLFGGGMGTGWGLASHKKE